MRNGPRPSSITWTKRCPLIVSNGTSTAARPDGNVSSSFATGGAKLTVGERLVVRELLHRDHFVELGVATPRSHVKRDAHALYFAAIGIDLGARRLGLALDQALDELGVDVDPELERTAAFGGDGDDVVLAAFGFRTLLVLDARPPAIGIPEREAVAIRGIGRELERRGGGLDLGCVEAVLRPDRLAVVAHGTGDRADVVAKQRLAGLDVAPALRGAFETRGGKLHFAALRAQRVPGVAAALALRFGEKRDGIGLARRGRLRVGCAGSEGCDSQEKMRKSNGHEKPWSRRAIGNYRRSARPAKSAIRIEYTRRASPSSDSLALRRARSRPTPTPRPLAAVARGLSQPRRALRCACRKHACSVRGTELDRLRATRRHAGSDRPLLLSLRRHRLCSFRYVAPACRRADLVDRARDGRHARCSRPARSRPLRRDGHRHRVLRRVDRALRRADAMGRHRSLHFGDGADRIQDRRRDRDRSGSAAPAARARRKPRRPVAHLRAHRAQLRGHSRSLARAGSGRAGRAAGGPRLASALADSPPRRRAFSRADGASRHPGADDRERGHLHTRDSMAGVSRPALGRDRYLAAAVAGVLSPRLQRRHRRGSPPRAAPRVRDRSQPRARRARCRQCRHRARPRLSFRRRAVPIARQRRSAGAHAAVARGVLGVDGDRSPVPDRLFDHLPQPLLAALVLASVASMFKVDELRQLFRVSRGSS